MNNIQSIRNIASRNSAQPLYALEVEYEGIHINIQGHDLQSVKAELWEEVARIDCIVMSDAA